MQYYYVQVSGYNGNLRITTLNLFIYDSNFVYSDDNGSIILYLVWIKIIY